MASKSSNHSANGGSGRTKVGRYELGRTLGEGSFAKVKFARNPETGENVAIKILDKEKVLKHKMIGQVYKSFPLFYTFNLQCFFILIPVYSLVNLWVVLIYSDVWLTFLRTGWNLI